MIESIINNKLDLTLKKPEDLKKVKDFDIRAALGSHSDFNRIYSNPRAWFMHKYLIQKNINVKDHILILLEKVMIYRSL